MDTAAYPLKEEFWRHVTAGRRTLLKRCVPSSTGCWMILAGEVHLSNGADSVARVLVSEGEAVERGQTLLEMGK